MGRRRPRAKRDKLGHHQHGCRNEWGTQQVLRARWGGPKVRVSTDGETEAQVSGRAEPSLDRSPQLTATPASALSPVSAAGQSLSPEAAPPLPAGCPSAGTQAVASREGRRLPWVSSSSRDISNRPGGDRPAGQGGAQPGGRLTPCGRGPSRDTAGACGQQLRAARGEGIEGTAQATQAARAEARGDPWPLHLPRPTVLLATMQLLCPTCSPGGVGGTLPELRQPGLPRGEARSWTWNEAK